MKGGINGLCFLSVFLWGCSGTTDIIRYTESEDNGLRKQINVGQTEYTVQYKPVSYILAMEQPEPEKVPERKQQLEDIAWFNIYIRVRDFSQSPLRYQVSGLEEYNLRLNYYLNEAQKDLYLLYGNRDTLPLCSYWFENNQNLTNHETIVVGFALPENKKNEDLQLVFYDRVFKNGIIKTKISAGDIAAIPH